VILQLKQLNLAKLIQKIQQTFFNLFGVKFKYSDNGNDPTKQSQSKIPSKYEHQHKITIEKDM